MRKKRKKKIIITVIVLVLLAVAGLCVGYYVKQYMRSKVQKVQEEELDEKKVQVNEVKEETKEVIQEYTTIALFGLDNRDTGNYEQGNSDVIMIMSLNNKTKEFQMVSVYRDTYVNIQTEDEKYRKANAAYAYGGAEGAVSMLNKNFDLDIDNYVTFDFETVADAIDALGGVDVEITSKEELKWLNMYVDHTNDILGTDSKSISGIGVHTLDGVQAVAYGRIRYTSGSDYRRAERHRIVLTELLKKAKEADLRTLSHLVDIVFPEIKTDLTEDQIMDLIPIVLEYDLKDSRGFPFEKNNTTLPNPVGNIDVACDLVTNVKELHEYLYGNTAYEPSDEVVEYSEKIEEDTGFSLGDEEKDRFEETDDFEKETDPIELDLDES